MKIKWRKINGRLVATLDGNTIIGYIKSQNVFGWWESPFDATSFFVRNPQLHGVVQCFQRLKDAKQWITDRTTKDGVILKQYTEPEVNNVLLNE